MIDKHITVDEIRWRRVLPWLNLFRIPDLALRGRTVALAVLAVLVFVLGNAALRKLPFIEAKVSESLFPVLADVSTVVSKDSVSFWGPTSVSRNIKGQWLDARKIQTETHFRPWNGNYGWSYWPMETVYRSARQLFEFGNSWSAVATTWTSLLWALLVWGIFGGAASRMMAIRFARDESVSMRMALSFAIRNWQCYLYGPLLPMLGVGTLTLIAFTVGSVERWLEASNGTVLTILGFVPVLCALATTFLLVLAAVGWPLMTAAISVEGSDGFDGLSRAFSYLLNRLWHLLGLTLLIWVVGYFVNDCVFIFFDTVLWLTNWSVGPISENDSATLWLHVLNMTRIGVSVSLFWSATTVVYFLLRQREDGTPLDQVYMPGPPPKPDSLPVVGVAASQQPVIEQPLIERPRADADEAASK